VSNVGLEFSILRFLEKTDFPTCAKGNRKLGTIERRVYDRSKPANEQSYLVNIDNSICFFLAALGSSLRVDHREVAESFSPCGSL